MNCLRIALPMAMLCAARAPAATATASSRENETLAAERAVDGDPTTRWSSAFSDPQWLQVDLGCTQDIVGVRIHWEAAYGQSYEILTSLDGVTWCKAYQTTDDDGGLDDIYFGRKTCRYLRLVGLKRGTAWGYSIFELEPKGVGEEITLLVSSSQMPGSTECVFDGNPATVWHSHTDDPAPWLRLRADAGILCAGVCMTWGPERPASCILEVSDDGTNWEAVARADEIASDRTTVLRASVAGSRFLQLRFRPRAKDQAVSVGELRFLSWAEQAGLRSLENERGIVGDENRPWVTFVGRDGSFAPEPLPCRFTVWLTEGRHVYAPDVLPTIWALKDGHLPIYEVAWTAGVVRVVITVFARHVQALDRLVTFARATVENAGPNPANLQLHLLVRPNPLASKWNKRLDRAVLDGRTVVVNGRPVLVVKGEPAGSAHELIQRLGAVGPGCVISFDAPLAPAERRSFDFIAIGGEEPPPSPDALLALDFDEHLASAVSFWRKRVPMELVLPEKAYADAFYASLYYLLILMKGTALYPGAYNYKSWFLHDAVEMNAALDAAGLHDVARRVTPNFRFGEHSGYLDELGGSIFALYEHYRFTRDLEYLRSVYPRMVEACRLARDLRRRQEGAELRGTPYYGLMPKSVSQDNFSIPAYLYVDNWWAINGLKSCAEAARTLGESNDLVWITAEYEALLSNTLSSIRQVMAREGTDYMPGFADDWPKSERKVDPEHRILGDAQMAWAHRPALFPGRSLGVPVPFDLFRSSYRRYWDRAGRFSGFDGGWFVEYERLFWGYNVQLAIPPMFLGLDDITLANITWSLRHTSCPGGWSEGMLARQNEAGLWELAPGPVVGDVPHGWSAAYYVLLLRNMLLREDGRRMLLLPCVPEDWWSAGQRMTVGNAATYFGPFGFEARVSDDGRHVCLMLDTPPAPPDAYVLHLPRTRHVSSLRIDGEPAPVPRGAIVEIPGRVTRVDVVF